MGPQVHDHEGHENGKGHAGLDHQLGAGCAHDGAMGGMDQDQQDDHAHGEKAHHPTACRP